MSEDQVKKSASCALVIFSKAPIAGEVKTRLAKDLGNSAALNVYQAMLKTICRTLTQSSRWDCFLSASKHLDHPFFTSLIKAYGLKTHLQCDGTLGDKMKSTLEVLQSEYEKVIIVGGDAISISECVVDTAFKALDTYDSVLVPALDGGYIAIGATTTHEQMFTGIEWGTERVFAQQKAQFQSIGWRCWFAEPLWDLDELADFERAKSEPELHQKLLDAGLNQAL